MLSLVTACMNRDHHLRRTLPHWLALPGVDEVLIVDWSNPSPLDDLLGLGALGPGQLHVVRVAVRGGDVEAAGRGRRDVGVEGCRRRRAAGGERDPVALTGTDSDSDVELLPRVAVLVVEPALAPLGSVTERVPDGQEVDSCEQPAKLPLTVTVWGEL